MKHLIRYEGYTTQERLNDILDKISQYGIKSLTSLESEFLDSHKSNTEEETHNKVKYIENERIFEDDSGRFKFEYKETKYLDNEDHYIGTMYVPDLEVENDKKIDGRLDGMIIHYDNESISLDFEKGKYDIFEFCSGLEYELDNFIDYIVSELSEKNR